MVGDRVPPANGLSDVLESGSLPGAALRDLFVSRPAAAGRGNPLSLPWSQIADRVLFVFFLFSRPAENAFGQPLRSLMRVEDQLWQEHTNAH